MTDQPAPEGWIPDRFDPEHPPPWLDVRWVDCASICRVKGKHTRYWGECALAVEPEPTVSMSVVFTDSDGERSIGFDQYTVQQLADLIEAALRGVAIRLGPNALAMLQRGEQVGPSGGEYADLARAAAHAIIHLNDSDGDDHA